MRVEEYLSISGISQDLAGKPLTLLIDNLYQMGAGTVPSNGLWSFRFRFTSAGTRSLVVLAQDDLGNPVRSQSISLVVVAAPPPPLQVTSLPHQVKREEFFIINGIAQGLAGQPLTLTVDDRFQFSAGTLPATEPWSIRFRFTSTGNRKLVFSTPSSSGTVVSSPPVLVSVLEVLEPTIQITTFPAQVTVRQEFVIAGTASGVNAQPVMLSIDNQFKVSAGLVAADGSWQTTTQFLQAGTRRLTASVNLDLANLDSANPAPSAISKTVVIKVVPASPRLTITPPTQPIYAEAEFTLTGAAKNFADGEQLVVRADRQYVLARPIVQNQRWQAKLFFNQDGKRLIEVIASEQEQEQIELTVQAAPSSLRLFARTIWTTTPTPEGLPDLSNPRRITLHHTVIAALSTGASQQQEIQRMRRVLDIHLNSSGYSDIGYHYIVMPSGRVYEARSSRKRGAHDLVNDGIGVAVDGDFQGSLRIGEQQYESVVKICVMLCRRMGITDPITPVSTLTADFGTLSLSRILGHRDRVLTACPGTVYQRLAEIRRDVKQEL